MNLAFLQNELVLAVCWTLIHSIWQGLLLAGMTGAVMIATRGAHARRRYTILASLFFLFIIATVVTFIRELLITGPATNPAVFPDQFPVQALTAGSVTQSGEPVVGYAPGFLNRFVNYFNEHAVLIFTVWFIVFVAKFIRLTASLVYVQRLQYYRSYAPPVEWIQRLNELVARIGIDKGVRLLESGMVKVPVVMGMFKPVILLPMGLLAQLPADEIEAILLHELAHIRRRDYFVNLLQSFAETVFFFNPAILWLSAMIREERENCCDDIAIAVTNNKTKFINALISFQEYHFAASPPAMAFPGSRNQLLNRVKRIMNNRNKTLNAAEKSILSLGIAVFILFSFVAAEKVPVEKQKGFVKEHAPKGKSIPASVKVPDKKDAAIAIYGLTDTVIQHGKADRDNKSDSSGDRMVKQDVQSASGADRDPLRPLSPLGSLAPLNPFSDTVPDLFAHFSANVHDDGKTRTMILTATGKDGKEYRLKKINDVLKEFSVNGAQVPESQLTVYEEVIGNMEAAYRNKQEQGRARRAEAEQRRLVADATRKMGADRKAQLLKERELVNRERRSADLIREKMAAEGKRAFQEQRRAADTQHRLFDKQRRLFEKNRKDSFRNEVLDEKKQETIERKLTEEKKQLIDKQISLNKQRILDIQVEQKLGITNKAIWKKNQDSILKKAISKEKAAALDKAAWWKIREAEDRNRIEQSAGQIRSIIADLQKGDVKVDMEHSWFALDQNRLIVDGKSFQGALHERLKAKYLTPGGTGYFYGPVKVTGRGLFMEYKDLSR